MPRPSTPPPPPPPPPGGSTLIFDFSDLPPSPEELAALQAQKKHRRLASLKARRRLSAKALSSSPLPGAPLEAPPPQPHPFPFSRPPPRPPRCRNGRKTCARPRVFSQVRSPLQA
jgi:hypothetical protein